MGEELIMIAQIGYSMIQMLMVKFMLNDIPHAAGIVPNNSNEESSNAEYSLSAISGVAVSALMAVFIETATESSVGIRAVNLSPDMIVDRARHITSSDIYTVTAYASEKDILRWSPTLPEWQLTEFGTDVALVSAVYAERALTAFEAISDVKLSTSEIVKECQGSLPWIGKKSFNPASVIKMIRFCLLEA